MQTFKAASGVQEKERSAYHHADVVPLLRRDLLNGVLKNEVHELVKSAKDARHLTVAIQLDCRQEHPLE